MFNSCYGGSRPQEKVFFNFCFILIKASFNFCGDFFTFLIIF